MRACSSALFFNSDVSKTSIVSIVSPEAILAMSPNAQHYSHGSPLTDFCRGRAIHAPTGSSPKHNHILAFIRTWLPRCRQRIHASLPVVLSHGQKDIAGVAQGTGRWYNATVNRQARTYTKLDRKRSLPYTGICLSNCTF